MDMQPQPHDAFGWIVIVIGMIATIGTIAAALYWIVRPGENDPDHPKRIILKDDR